MSTVAQIKDAVEKLSAPERAQLRAEGDNPPGVREKLADAANGRFHPGDRSNIQKILSGLE